MHLLPIILRWPAKVIQAEDCETAFTYTSSTFPLIFASEKKSYP